MEADRVITAKSLIITAVLAGAALLFHSRGAAVAVLAGGAVAVANFRLGARVLKRIIVPGMAPAAGQSAGVLSFFVRYALLAAVLTVILRAGVQPVGFIAGLSAVVAAVFAAAPRINRGEV